MNTIGERRRLGSEHEQVSADICVIGAGIAGLIAATRIAAQSGQRVVLVESGGAGMDGSAATALNTIHDPAGRYRGEARTRRFGGTSSLWAGKLLPLSPHDMAARPYLGLEAWPIDPDRLARYTPEIEALMGIDGGAFEADEIGAPGPGGLLLPAPEGIRWRWVKRPSRANHRLEHVLRHELARLHQLAIWTEATVSSLTVREDRLVSVDAVNQRGGRLTITASRFVLAAGTLETTRLLLLVDAQNEGCISRTTDSLGRYFNDHFGLHPALVRPVSMRWANRALADRKLRGTLRHLHGELSAQWQQATGAGSAYFDFDPEFGPETVTGRARAVTASLQQRAVPQALRHLAWIAANPAALAREAAGRLGPAGRIPWPESTSVHAKLWLEQLPDRRNRLSLSNRRDMFGVPMLEADLRKTEADQRTLAAVLDRLRAWGRTVEPAAALEWTPAANLEVEETVEQAHPAGSTRMGHNPAQSVLNPSLRTHALANVWIASASAFPSSGSANPTLTIMQMAMLVADEVAAAYTSVPADMRGRARPDCGDVGSGGFLPH